MKKLKYWGNIRTDIPQDIIFNIKKRKYFYPSITLGGNRQKDLIALSDGAIEFIASIEKNGNKFDINKVYSIPSKDGSRTKLRGYRLLVLL